MKNRILRSALSVALCAAMLLSQGLTAFAENEIVPSPNNEGNSAAAEFSLLEEKAGEPSVTDGENVPETPASTEDETKTETTTGQPTAEDDTAKETTAKTPAVVSEEEKSEESTAAPAEAQAATNSLKGWGGCDRPSNQPIPLPSESDVIAALPGFSFDCENSNCNASESIELNDLVFTIGEVNRKAGTVDITFDNAAFSTSLAKFNEKCGKHNLAKEQPIVVTLTWNAKKDYWYYAGNEQNIIVPVECDKGCHPDPIPLPNKSDVIAALPGFSFDCENSNCNAYESIELKDLVFTIGEVNRKAGTVDITFDNAAFSTSLAKFNEKYGKHNLAKEQPIVVTLTWNAKKDYWYYAGNEQNIIVPVECSFPSNNVPAVPTYKDLEELLGNMTVYCVNENHLVSKAYPITWNTIGGLNQKPVQNDDGTFSMEITVSYDPFKDLFEDDFGAHDYVESIELARSVVSLKWSEIEGVGAWRVDGSFINSFNVICDTPSTESLWGWNNGKEVIITCVEENALHTKGMTLSLVGVNGDKYWKFDPITWDQEQKCYTTTVTLEPDKYLEVYSGQYGEHALVSDHEDTVLSLKLSYQDGNQDGNGKWISNGDKFYLFVKCNAPSKPTIEDLDRLFTNNTKVNISCEKNKHADKWYPVKDNSVDRLGYLFIGPVEVDDNNHYTAKISLNDAFFINLYNQEEGGDHSLVSKTYITLSYDGEKWVFNDESKLDFDVVVTCPDNDNPGGGEDPGTNPGGGDNGNNGGNNNGGSTGGGSSVSRRDDDDDWEPLPNNNYRVTKKNDKPSQNTQIVVRDPADNSDNTSSNTGSDSGKHNPETGDTTTAFAAMALAAVSLGGAVLLGRKKK